MVVQQTVTARAPSKRRVAVAAPPAVESASALKEEIALLAGANAALGRGDVKRALALLEDYDRRPGAGVLAEERAVTGILVSCAAGRVNAARAERGVRSDGRVRRWLPGSMAHAPASSSRSAPRRRFATADRILQFGAGSRGPRSGRSGRSPAATPGRRR